MANFTVTNSTVGTQQSVAATYKSICFVAASSQFAGGLKRGKVYDILVGTDAAPGDTYVEWAVHRCTIVANSTWNGSVSSISSVAALDQADGAVNSLLAANASAETGITSKFVTWYVGVNQRASYRWVAAPGSELVWPAISSGTGGNGFALAAQGSYTGTATGTVMVSEQ